MNMEAYQKFIKMKNFIVETTSRRDSEKVIRDKLPELRKKQFYKGVDDDYIIQHEISNDERLIRETELYLQTCQVFELEDKHKHLMLLTNNPREKDKELFDLVRLPFPQIFIDTSFEAEDWDENDTGAIHGLLIRELKEIGKVIDSNNKDIKETMIYGLQVTVCGISGSGSPFIDCFRFPLNNVDGTKWSARYSDPACAKFLKSFIINFILFLKDREVVIVERKRDSKGQMRRVKEGKLELPSSKLVKLEGQIKRYVDSISDGEFKGKLSYKFWVRGHWRHLNSPKFIDKRGKVIWIEPYKKGQGVEVKHIYRVEPEDESRTLDYDDIPEGKAPMRESN